MHLISPLAAGISGAGNGTARIYTRGTSARATYFTDFEASDSGSTADIALNSYGRAIVYVNGLVDVVVTKSGVEIARFTAGVNAAAVELISTGASGTDYETLATGRGEPTTLKAMVDVWPTIAGGTTATFGYVNPFSTGNIPLYQALQNATSFLSVKSYGGAKGDGATNDTSAIQNTLTAASSSSIWNVYVPPGTYVITSTLTVPAGVRVFGAGQAKSIISLNHASTPAMNFDADGGYQIALQDITVSAAVSWTGGSTVGLVQFEDGSFYVKDTTIGNSNVTGSTSAIRHSQSSTARVFIHGGSVVVGSGGSTNGISELGSSLATFTGLYGVLFRVANAGAYTGTLVITCPTQIVGCIFDTTLVTSGSHNGISVRGGSSTTNFGVTSCWFRAPAGGTHTAMNCNYTLGSVLSESGCTFESGVVAYAFNSTGVLLTTASLATREGRWTQVDNDTAGAQTVDATNYGTILWRRQNNGTQTPTLSTCPPGCRFKLIWWNDHGAGGGTITLAAASGAIRSEFASEQFTVAANSIRIMSFVSVAVNGANRWIQDGESTDDETE